MTTRCRICDASTYGCHEHPRDPSTVKWDRTLRRCVPHDAPTCMGEPFCDPELCGGPCHHPSCPVRTSA
jgi:hypothetical protein